MVQSENVDCLGMGVPTPCMVVTLQAFDLSQSQRTPVAKVDSITNRLCPINAPPEKDEWDHYMLQMPPNQLWLSVTLNAGQEVEAIITPLDRDGMIHTSLETRVQAKLHCGCTSNDWFAPVLMATNQYCDNKLANAWGHKTIEDCSKACMTTTGAGQPGGTHFYFGNKVTDVAVQPSTDAGLTRECVCAMDTCQAHGVVQHLLEPVQASGLGANSMMLHNHVEGKHKYAEL